MYKSNVIAVVLLFLGFSLTGQTGTEIMKKAMKAIEYNSSYAELSMEVIRPDWNKTIGLKIWTKGSENVMVAITAPERDKGTAFLKDGSEVWNWQPKIKKVISLPASMMMQAWMGSDFSNDGLLRQSSMLSDFSHELLGKEEIDGREVFKILSIPTGDTEVLWGKLESWIDATSYTQVKTAFYDEEEFLVHTMYARDFHQVDGITIPKELEIIPADEEGSSTTIIYKLVELNPNIESNFFSKENMKSLL